jgi:hypothetical protein
MSEQQSYSEQIAKVSPMKGDLLVVTSAHHLTPEQREKMAVSLTPMAERLGVQLLVLDGGVTAQLQPGIAGLLEEQRKQTAILQQIAGQQLQLIQALGEDEPEEPDAQPLRYMDGTPCR